MGFFWDYAAYNVPNYLLAVAMYTLLGRLVLGLFVPEQWDNYIWRAFRWITDPVLAAVRAISPALIAGSWLILAATVWVMIARVAFTLAMVEAGLTPPIGPGGS